MYICIRRLFKNQLTTFLQGKSICISLQKQRESTTTLEQPSSTFLLHVYKKIGGSISVVGRVVSVLYSYQLVYMLARRHASSVTKTTYSTCKRLDYCCTCTVAFSPLESTQTAGRTETDRPRFNLAAICTYQNSNGEASRPPRDAVRPGLEVIAGKVMGSFSKRNASLIL